MPNTAQITLTHEASDTSRLLALAEACSAHLADRAAQVLADGLERFCTAVLTDDLTDLDDSHIIVAARHNTTEQSLARWATEMQTLHRDGITTTFVCDDAYPTNLRMVYNRPPILFYRGSFTAADIRSVAVVGSRSAGDEGLAAAAAIAGHLAAADVTVVSGLARGIDTAAHIGALDAGGRTIAVLGQGLRRSLPAAQVDLARRIAQRGAVVSQWWPGQAVTRWTLPLRNIVTSGLSTATIVVEAGESSGARLQANDALKHGKRVYVVDQLVSRQSWARRLIDDGLAIPIGIDEVDVVVDGVNLDACVGPPLVV